MAKYEAKYRSFIGGSVIEAGEQVEYDGIPGSNLIPLDDAAKAAVKKRDDDKARAKAAPQPATLPHRDPDKKLVEIPADWRELSKNQRVALARRLGAPEAGTNAEAADKFIEAEIANRAVV